MLCYLLKLRIFNDIIKNRYVGDIMYYLGYSIEQIMSECSNYQSICNLFFELVKDVDKIKLKEILYEGKFNEFYLNSQISSNDNPFREAQRRVEMAYLFIKNPETFDVLVSEKVNLFHGTNANALPSILKYGLNSGLESERQGINVSTGEQWSRIGGKQRNFVSFTDVLDVAYYYSSIKPSDSDFDFEVVIGTTVDDARKVGTTNVFSDTPEIGIKNKLSIDNIKIIGVPSDKVNFVRNLVSNSLVKIVAIDCIRERFFYMDDFTNKVNIYYDDFNKLKESLSSHKRSKFFKLDELKKMMIKRFLLKFKKIKNKGLDKEEMVSGKSR